MYCILRGSFLGEANQQFSDLHGPAAPNAPWIRQRLRPTSAEKFGSPQLQLIRSVQLSLLIKKHLSTFVPGVGVCDEVVMFFCTRRLNWLCVGCGVTGFTVGSNADARACFTQPFLH